MTEENKELASGAEIANDNFYSAFPEHYRNFLEEVHKVDPTGGYFQVMLEGGYYVFDDDPEKKEYSYLHFNKDTKILVDGKRFTAMLMDSVKDSEHRFIVFEQREGEFKGSSIITLFKIGYNPALLDYFEKVKTANEDIAKKALDENTNS